MDLSHMKAAIESMAASELSEMTLTHEGWTLRLVKQNSNTIDPPSPAPNQASELDATAPERIHHILAPVFGLVHLQPAPGQAAYVQVGNRVTRGQTVCTIEAMKVFNEVCAESAGRVSSIHVSSGSEVEAGQVIVEIELDEHV